MITPVFFLAFLLVLFEIAKLCEFDSAGILAGVASVLMTPFILWDGSQVKNDTELALFQVAALYCCLRWRSSDAARLAAAGRRSFWRRASASSTLRRSARSRWRCCSSRHCTGSRAGCARLRCSSCCLAVFGFYWHARTFLLTGDPLFPRRIEEAVTPRVRPVLLVTWQGWNAPGSALAHPIPRRPPRVSNIPSRVRWELCC